MHGWRRRGRLPRTRTTIPKQGGSRSHGRSHVGDLWNEIMKNWTTEAFTGRARLVFTRLQAEGVDLPSEAKGLHRLCGCRLRSLGLATIMSATRKSWEFVEVCTAIRTSFPGCPDRWERLLARTNKKNKSFFPSTERTTAGESPCAQRESVAQLRQLDRAACAICGTFRSRRKKRCNH